MSKICGPRKFAGNSRTIIRTVVASGFQNDPLAPSNAGRSSICFGPFNTTGIYYGPKDKLDSSGLEAFSTTEKQGVVYKFEEWGDLVTGEWTFSTTLVGQLILVVEVYWQ